jgi:type I restriction enzyme S subunit
MMEGRYRAYPEYKDSGVEWLGKMPTAWVLSRLKYMAHIKNGQDYKTVETNTGYPVLGSGGQFTFASTFLYDKESVLLGRKGTIDKPLYIDEPFWTVDTMYYTEIDNEIPPKFLYYLALIIQFRMFSTNTALPSMTQENLGNFIFAVPPRKSDKILIANFLDHEIAKIDTLIEKQQQLITLLQEKRQAVISHAVTKGLNPDAPMKDSGVEWLGEVPEQWDLTEIRFITKQIGGGTPDKSNESYWGGDIPWVSPKDMKVNYIGASQNQITVDAVNQSPAKFIPEGSVLMVVRGMILLHSVPVALTTKKVTINQDMKAMVPLGKISGEFLLFLLKGLRDFLLDIVDSSAHGTKCLRTELFERMKIAIPDRAEQNIIVEAIKHQLGLIDLLTNKAERAITLLQERRTALISAAVTGKIDVRDWQPPTSSSSDEADQ